MIWNILRAVGVLICAAAWWWLSSGAKQAPTPEGTGEAFKMSLPLLAAQGALIIGAIILAKPIAGLIGDLMGNLFMPGARHDKPQPMYSIPEGRLTAEDYPGALEAFAELASEHPEEITPHLRMMEIWLRVYRDPEAAQTIRENALVSIKGRGNRKKFEMASGVILEEAGIDVAGGGGVAEEAAE